MPTGRANQLARTRRAIVDAARALMGEGGVPTMAAVAEAALVSEATLYRHFPNAQALWVAVARADEDSDDPELALGSIDDAVERVDAMVRAVGWVQYDEEQVWRTALRAFLDGHDAASPLARSGQRMRWIDAALQPLEGQLDRAELTRLRAALALVFGMESLVTLRDVCGLDPDDAKEVSLWAARALVRHVLGDR